MTEPANKIKLIHAVILSGGKGTRIGGHKHEQILGDKPLLEHVITALLSQVDKLAVNLPITVDCDAPHKNKTTLWLEQKKIPYFNDSDILKDIFQQNLPNNKGLGKQKDLGPLLGIASALLFYKKHSTKPDNTSCDWILTCPCDTPFIGKNFCDTLISNILTAKKIPDIAYATYHNQPHFLYALWRPYLLNPLLKALKDNQLAVKQFIAQNNTLAVDFSKLIKFNQDLKKINHKKNSIDPFFNINTKKDLDIAEEYLKKLSHD